MRLDLEKEYANYEDYKSYIYGSADVVGLMSKVFVQGDSNMYNQLKLMQYHLDRLFKS